jgi:predicted lipid-binding transport protein (Tim44 family)
MRRFIPVLIAVMLVLAPALAAARPGLGMSMGSRGSHTWSSAPGTSSSPSGASPFQRSMTPNSYGSGAYGSSGYGRYGSGMGMGMRGGFASGLMGGLIGAGIGGMLFGHGFFGFHGGGGFLGLLLQLVLLYFLARWVMRRFMGAPAMAGGGGFGFARNMFQQQGRPAMGGGPTMSSSGSSRPVNLASPDYQQFSQLLQGIQAAWTNHDLNGLQAMATPEMVSYFAEQMSEQTSQGVRNQVTGVQLQQGDLSEAWAEGNRDYATVSMRFSMFDVTKDTTGRVVDGSATERVTVTEFWTFLRSSGGHWILSAIQQTR